MAVRRQQQCEVQLKEKAFTIGTIKPIVDETVAYKAPIPYALREVKRIMRGVVNETPSAKTDQTQRNPAKPGQTQPNPAKPS